MRSVPGEEPLSHPIICKYLVKLYHTELQGRDVQLFSQFWGRVVNQLRQMVRGGTQPQLDDGTLQNELRDAAMAQINHLWLHERQRRLWLGEAAAPGHDGAYCAMTLVI